jgi:hypothetical protein
MRRHADSIKIRKSNKSLPPCCHPLSCVLMRFGRLVRSVRLSRLLCLPGLGPGSDARGGLPGLQASVVARPRRWMLLARPASGLA